MNNLSKDWLTEHHIDLELKKYTILAYLQQVKENYKLNKVYPWLGDLIEHYKNLITVKKNTENLKDGFGKEFIGFDLKEWKLKYSATESDDEMITTIQEIIDYSLPLLAQNIHQGKSIYDLVEEHLKLEAIGISPLKTDEGYLLLHCKEEKNVHVYQYAVSFYQSNEEKYRSISTHFISDYSYSIATPYEKMKRDLIIKNKELPNPAVYAVNCTLTVPLQETFLPIAKRYFVSRMGF